MSNNILSNDGFQIFKNNLSAHQLKTLKTNLTVTPKTNQDYGGDTESFQVYKELSDKIIIPRYYGTKVYGKPVWHFDNKNSSVDFEFTGKLRENQVEVARYALEKIKSDGGGILQLHTGYGKTTMAIYLASILKLKTLVIVHKTFLQDQWYDRIKQFTTASIGMIRQKKVDIEGKDIVIGMLQSISMIDYDKEIFKDFDLIIADECFPGNTLIETNNGQYKIGELYDMWINKEELPLIKSYNESNKMFEYKKMTYAWKKQTDKLVKVKFADNYVICTPNHKFLTIYGYKEASELSSIDILVGQYNSNLQKNGFTYALNDDQMQIIYGSYLADDHLSKIDNRKYNMRSFKNINKKEYCEWKASMLNCNIKILEDNLHSDKSILFFVTKCFDLENEIPCNKLNCPDWIINKLDYRGLCIWYLESGSFQNDSRTLSLSSYWFNENSQIKLVNKLKNMGLDANYVKLTYGSYSIELSDQSSIIFIRNIYPYLNKNIVNYLRLIPFIDESYTCDKYVWDNKFLNYGTYKVLNVSYIDIDDQNKDVFDIEVEDNHNFVVLDNKNINGVVVHNCHHFSSRVFSRALLKIFPKYTIGLSATPNRNDGLTKVFKWFLGDTLVKVERKGDNAVYIKSFTYTSNDKLFAEKKRFIKTMGGSKPDTVKMITNMYKIEDRNIFISKILNALRCKDERKTLVLSGRIEHLKTLKKLVDNDILKDIESGKCSVDEFTTSFYIGGMKDYELKESENADIIFATYSMAEEGLDIDGLNTLILATPKKNIIQSIGRIMRKPIQEGDINPLIIDIIDNLSCFKSWGEQRIKYYKSKNYTVSNYKSFNNELIPFKEFMVNENILSKDDLEKDDFDIRKEYILKKYGKCTYEFELEIEFENFPDEMFNYECNYNKIFEINHDYSNVSDIPKVEVTFNAGFNIEI
jgi:superfamily II DNA or RNA helicase